MNTTDKFEMEKTKELKLFLLDMDGTIYLDNDLFDGTLDFLEYVKSIGGRYMFLTNNSSKGVSAYVNKLEKLGIKAEPKDFFTSVDATVMYLSDKNYKKIYAFGTESFKKQLLDSGYPVTDKLEDDIDCLLLGYDTELTYRKLEDACILLGRGVDYIATNPDWVCPMSYGYAPDCGAISQMICHATKRMPKFIGKPEPDMALAAMKKAGYTKGQTAIIGDRLYTDVKCGVNAGICSVFVLSGEGVLEDTDKYDVHPDIITDNIKTFLEILKENR